MFTSQVHAYEVLSTIERVFHHGFVFKRHIKWWNEEVSTYNRCETIGRGRNICTTIVGANVSISNSPMIELLSITIHLRYCSLWSTCSIMIFFLKKHLKRCKEEEIFKLTVTSTFKWCETIRCDKNN